MKKKQMWCGLTFAAFGLLTSCSSEETLDVPVGNPIQFAYTNVDASTRGAEGEEGGEVADDDASDEETSTGATDPSFTTESLQKSGFNVYGWVSNGTDSSVLFDGTEVTYDDGWTYENTQYWVGGGSYTFSAIAGMNGTLTISEDGKRVASPKIVGFTTNGETDLIYDEQSVNNYSSGEQTVTFAFKHQLAKVKFTFIDGMPVNSQIGIKVTNIKITDAPASGDVVLSATQGGATWSNLSTTTVGLDFGSTGDDFITKDGSECSTELLLIPAASTQEYTVTFSTDIYQGASGSEVLIKTANHSTTIKNVELKSGCAYVFTATLNEDNLDGGNGLYPIVFDVDLTTGWGEGSTSAITNYPKSNEDDSADDNTANGSPE
jgi:hypothetical protein